LARTALEDQEITQTDMMTGNGDSERGGLWLGAGRSIFIVVTHFVGEKTWRIDGFFGNADFFFVDRLGETTRRVDRLFSNTNFFLVGWLSEAAGRINGSFVDSYFLTDFAVVTWLEVRNVDGSLDASVLTVAWLVLGSVLTFYEVNIGFVGLSALRLINFSVVVVAAVMSRFDFDFSITVVVVVVSAKVWKVYLS
jgi:hypothetical protein